MESATYDTYNTIILDGVAFPVLGGVGYDNLNRFPQKITQGDYSFDSDDLTSVRIWSDLTGGLGEEHPKAGVDDNRYRDGTLWVSETDTFTLPRLTTMVPGANTSGCFLLGDLNVGGTVRFFACYGTQVQLWDEATRTFGAPITALAAAPVNKPVAFKGIDPNRYLYIPQGSGYQRFDGTNAVAAQNTAILPIAFTKWDTRLWALSADGRLSSSFDGVTWNTEAILDGSETPTNMIVYLNRAEEDTIYLVTTSAIWGYNPNTGSLVLTKFQPAPHPFMGKGVAVWHPGEDMYISAGLQVYQWNLSSAALMGPAKGDGLPPELRGHIVDLCPAHGELYCLVQGKTVLSAATESTSTDVMGDDPPYGNATAAASSLLMWTGFGWHECWVNTTASSDLPSWAMVSAAQSAYRLWWGVGGNAYTQTLSAELTGMRQNLNAGEGEFEEVASLDTGWYDAGMRAFQKLLSHCELCLDIGSATEYIDVSYRMDHDSLWTHLGRADMAGRTSMPFGVNANGFSEGMEVDRIRFLLEAARAPGDANKTLSPLGNAFILKFLKLPLPSSSHNVTIPLTYDTWNGRSARQIKADLDALIAKPGFVELRTGGLHATPQRVRLTGVRGLDETGENQTGQRDITIVQIEVPPSMPADLMEMTMAMEGM